MMFRKSIITLSALLVLASAMTLERNAPAHDLSILTEPATAASGVRASTFAALNSECDKEDEDDCKEFCSIADQTATCSAYGNKVTCSCKGGKSAPPSNCEERCLFCAPDRSALEEARHLFSLMESKFEEL